MSERSTAKTTKTRKYVAVRNCVYNNRWTPRGTIIEVPEGQEIGHSCFELATEANTAFIDARKKGVMYDPMNEAIEARTVNEVMAGVYKN